jgi:hypothetical protein
MLGVLKKRWDGRMPLPRPYPHDASCTDEEVRRFLPPPNLGPVGNLHLLDKLVAEMTLLTAILWRDGLMCTTSEYGISVTSSFQSFQLALQYTLFQDSLSPVRYLSTSRECSAAVRRLPARPAVVLSSRCDLSVRHVKLSGWGRATRILASPQSVACHRDRQRDNVNAPTLSSICLRPRSAPTAMSTKGCLRPHTRAQGTASPSYRSTKQRCSGNSTTTL